MLVPTLEPQGPLDLKRQVQRAVPQRRDLVDQLVDIGVAAMSRVRLPLAPRGRPRVQAVAGVAGNAACIRSAIWS